MLHSGMNSKIFGQNSKSKTRFTANISTNFIYVIYKIQKRLFIYSFFQLERLLFISISIKYELSDNRQREFREIFTSLYSIISMGIVVDRFCIITSIGMGIYNDFNNNESVS